MTEKEIVSIQPLPLLYNAYTTESSPISFKQSPAIPTGRTTNKLSFVQKPLPKLLPKIKHDNHANSESIRWYTMYIWNDLDFDDGKVDLHIAIILFH